jgi:dethiobiotin synthetase/adenosylmethionine--8-amino-7-oxononanoate aminotransferase
MPGGLPPAGSLLWRSLRIYQVYGANTEVGKTIFTTLLCKAAKSRPPGEGTVFLKPVSTGPDNEADEKCKGPLFSISFVLVCSMTDSPCSCRPLPFPASLQVRVPRLQLTDLPQPSPAVCARDLNKDSLSI